MHKYNVMTMMLHVLVMALAALALASYFPNFWLILPVRFKGAGPWAGFSGAASRPPGLAPPRPRAKAPGGFSRGAAHNRNTAVIGFRFGSLLCQLPSYKLQVFGLLFQLGLAFGHKFRGL